MHWSYQETSESPWKKIEKTKTSEEFEKYGPLAGFSYTAGLVSGRQLDFETAIYNFQNGLSTDWEDISRIELENFILESIIVFLNLILSEIPGAGFFGLNV